MDIRIFVTRNRIANILYILYQRVAPMIFCANHKHLGKIFVGCSNTKNVFLLLHEAIRLPSPVSFVKLRG